MRLLNSGILMLMFRRSAWIRWLPPIDSASPSPVMTHTDRSCRGRQASRDRGRPAVRWVQAVAVHVVRQPGRAADAGDDDDVLARHLKLGQEGLEGGQDRVVTAARAPPDLLVGFEVLHA
jgi:hypothetical protein